MRRRVGESAESFRSRRAAYVRGWRERRGLARRQAEREAKRLAWRRKRLALEISMWLRALGWSGRYE